MWLASRRKPDQLFGTRQGTATAAAEGITKIALRGQSTRLNPAGYAQVAARLTTTELRAIVRAIEVLASNSAETSIPSTLLRRKRCNTTD